MLGDAEGNWKNDAKFVADFQKACKESITRLEPLLTFLTGFIWHDAAQGEEAENISRYFEAWKDLYEMLERQLQEPQRWNPARQNALRQKDNALWELRRPLEANTALPRFSPLVPDIEPPAPAQKPPRDTG